MNSQQISDMYENAWPECNCSKCIDMCRNVPCLPTPHDAMRIMRTGYGDRLMLSTFWQTPLLSPALVGYEGEVTEQVYGDCTFLKDGLCEIHKIKPTEGKAAIHYSKDEDEKDDLHLPIINSWDSTIGRTVLKNWRMQYSKEGE